MYGIIYKATNNINGKSYIGQTIRSLTERKEEHIWESNNHKDDFAFHKAIRKYGAKNFSWTIIDYGSTHEQLNLKEEFWIDFYHTYGKFGYNMTTGGQGPHTMSKESWDKYRTSIANNRSKERQEKRDIESVSCKRCEKPIKNLNTGQIFACATDAAKSLGYTDSHDIKKATGCITRSARSKGASKARGYFWEYLPEEEARQYSKNAVRLVETGEIFRSCRQAALITGQTDVYISACCKGDIPDNCGYHWEYVNKKEEK